MLNFIKWLNNVCCVSYNIKYTEETVIVRLHSEHEHRLAEAEQAFINSRQFEGVVYYERSENAMEIEYLNEKALAELYA